MGILCAAGVPFSFESEYLRQAIRIQHPSAQLNGRKGVQSYGLPLKRTAADQSLVRVLGFSGKWALFVSNRRCNRCRARRMVSLASTTIETSGSCPAARQTLAALGTMQQQSQSTGRRCSLLWIFFCANETVTINQQN